MHRDPLIIIGMHRSGTSVLVHLLRELGVFLGWSAEKNGEARLFLALNDWMLAQAGGRWDQPEVFALIPEALRDRLARVAARHIRGFGRFSFLGPRFAWRCRRLENLPVLWGWKDPRNTFTLDVWLRMFPRARVLHIYRHPIDVAESLRQRSARQLDSPSQGIRRYLSEATLVRLSVYCTSVRALDIDRGVTLWTSYVRRALEWCDILGERAHSFSYEALVEDTAAEIARIAAFLSLRPGTAQVRAAAATVRSDRRLAFAADRRLLEAHRRIRNEPLIQQLGYGEPI